MRTVDMSRAIESFMQSVERTVNRTFSDVQLDKRFYRVDAKLHGDRMQVKYDPLAWDLETGNQDIVIAVIDSCVAYDHLDIINNVWKNTLTMNS